MTSSGISPNTISYTALLNGSIQTGDKDRIEKYINLLEESNMPVPYSTAIGILLTSSHFRLLYTDKRC